MLGQSLSYSTNFQPKFFYIFYGLMVDMFQSFRNDVDSLCFHGNWTPILSFSLWLNMP